MEHVETVTLSLDSPEIVYLCSRDKYIADINTAETVKRLWQKLHE